VQERLVTAVISRAPTAGSAVPGPEQKPPGGLTAREAEVLTLLAEGLSNAEIGKRLYLSNATVKTHINRIFAKTGARERAPGPQVRLPARPGDPGSVTWHRLRLATRFFRPSPCVRLA
jgi:DNA-binding NarL/FixJ family response regulator